MKKSVTALPGVHPRSARTPSWLCEEFVMTLREFRQGGIVQVEAEASLNRGRIPPTEPEPEP